MQKEGNLLKNAVLCLCHFRGQRGNMNRGRNMNRRRQRQDGQECKNERGRKKGRKREKGRKDILSGQSGHEKVFKVTLDT